MDQVVYVHGVVSQDPPRDHRADYAALRDGLSAAGVQLPPLDRSVLVEWGYHHPSAGDTASLATAEDRIGQAVQEATPPDRTSWRSLLFAPAITPVRELIQYRWADIAYYISEKGKARVRQAVWGLVLAQADVDASLDLTIIGHSAGALIAHDFLFWLFSGQRDDQDLKAMGVDADKVRRARANWRVRRLVTLGAPIAPLLVRSVEVTDLLARGELLDLSDLGFGRRSHAGPTPLWLNVWDRHDVLAAPVEPFYRGGRVRDLYPDHSDSLLDAHKDYWEARVVHQALADRWDAVDP